ncbi:MAG TPA: glutamine amidotransferase, partial [Nocardioides sp.]|nr:glutamine amidotransferase [Nocardioides sp.]
WTASSTGASPFRSEMKPFLFLGIRAQDGAADDEYAAVLRCAGLDERDLRRVRLERDVLGPVDLDDWSGIVVGGGPWNVSDPQESKPPEQLRGEARLRELALQVVEADFPFLGACYGIGTLGTLAGGVVDRQWSEPIGAVTISLTAEGVADPLLGGLPPEFDAFLGHKEAVSRLPRGAVLLASSATCPVQAFRIGERVYATQFHPELDVDSIVLRIEAYQDFGYFAPGEGDELIRLARAAVVTEPPRILERFVRLFAVE